MPEEIDIERAGQQREYRQGFGERHGYRWWGRRFKARQRRKEITNSFQDPHLPE
jgi:hypothetical protein